MRKMLHPDHGTHFCYSEQEYESCLEHGWKEDKPVKKDDVSKKKRGRPPKKVK